MDIRENAVKVYKDTAWVWLGVIFFIAMIAWGIYLLFTSDLDTWVYVVLGVSLVTTTTYFFDIKKNRNTIVVYPDCLAVEHAQRTDKAFIWEDAGTVEIPWSQIKRFSVEGIHWAYHWAYHYYMIVELQKGKSYRFAVFEPTKLFLKRQLKKYHKQYCSEL